MEIRINIPKGSPFWDNKNFRSTKLYTFHNLLQNIGMLLSHPGLFIEVFWKRIKSYQLYKAPVMSGLNRCIQVADWMQLKKLPPIFASQLPWSQQALCLPAKLWMECHVLASQIYTLCIAQLAAIWRNIRKQVKWLSYSYFIPWLVVSNKPIGRSITKLNVCKTTFVSSVWTILQICAIFCFCKQVQTAEIQLGKTGPEGSEWEPGSDTGTVTYAYRMFSPFPGIMQPVQR